MLATKKIHVKCFPDEHVSTAQHSVLWSQKQIAFLESQLCQLLVKLCMGPFICKVNIKVQLVLELYTFASMGPFFRKIILKINYTGIKTNTVQAEFFII